MDSTVTLEISEILPIQVPEPATSALLAAGGLLLTFRRRRLRKR